MKYTAKIGTFFGIPVRVHFTFPLILILLGAEAWFSGGPEQAARVVILVLAVFVCVVLHEFGHSLQLKRYGIPVRDIILLPIGGMARAEKIPERPWQEIVVAISGPAVNFALAIIFFLILWPRWDQLDFQNDFLLNLMTINIVLGLFNLIPAFPMDGGRILRGILAIRMPYLRATRVARGVGQVVALLFVVAGFLNVKLLMLPVIAVFIFFGAMSEERMVRTRMAFESRVTSDFTAALPLLRLPMTVFDAVSRLGDAANVPFPVTDASGRLAAVVFKPDLISALREGKGDEPLEGRIRTDFPLIDASAPALNSYHFLLARKQPFAGIVDGTRFVGLVLMSELTQAMP